MKQTGKCERIVMLSKPEELKITLSSLTRDKVQNLLKLIKTVLPCSLPDYICLTKVPKDVVVTSARRPEKLPSNEMWICSKYIFSFVAL